MLSLIRGQGLRALVLGNTGGVRNVEIRLGGLLLVFGDGCVPHDTCAVGLHGRSLPEVAFVGLGACPGASTPISFIDPRGAPPVNDAWQHQA